ncbi:MAG: hypothetical protein CMQ43_08070 [Gammaproteobacteria bacterium]|nr:hypothetical protein [Gammaproteobacteria bacterium]
MTCPDELMLMMRADDALDPASRAAVDDHAAGCAVCAARLSGLAREAGVLSAALTSTDEAPIPPLDLAGARTWFGALAGAGVVALLSLLAPAVLGAALPAVAGWFNPFDAWGLAEMAVDGVVFLVQNGDAIMTVLVETASVAVLVAFAVWLGLRFRDRRGGPLMLVSLLGVAALLPPPAEALDLRRAEEGTVLIPAGETIADTLIAFGETIEVDGDVEGDLVAFARRVSVRGRVGGSIVTGAETVTIAGEVGGSVLGFAETLSVPAVRIGGNLFGFGQSVETSAAIAQNALVFAERADVAGSVDRDVMGFGESVEIGGVVAGDVTAYANRLALLAPARVGGDVVANVASADNVTVSPSAVVDGEVTTNVREDFEDDHEFGAGQHIVFQLLWFTAKFVTGFALLALVPGLRQVSLETPTQAFLAGGIGVVSLVAVPGVAVLVAFTLIGLPLAAIAIVLWLIALYLAQIVVAYVVGARLLRGRGSHYAALLALGLAVVMLVVNVPFLGGLVSFLLTICGLGLLALFLWDRLRGDRGPEAAA